MNENKHILTGKIIEIDAEPTVYDSGFQKRTFLIETMEDEYAQTIKFELLKKRVGEIDDHEVGDVVDVHFNLRGGQGKSGTHFTNAIAWKIEKCQ